MVYQKNYNQLDIEDKSTSATDALKTTSKKATQKQQRHLVVLLVMKSLTRLKKGPAHHHITTN